MSPFGSSNRPINGEAERQSPAYAKSGTPRDVPQADKARAAGGPGQSFFAKKHDICERLRREVVWEPEIGDLLNEAADEITRLRSFSPIANCDTPQEKRTPSEGTVQKRCTLTSEERAAIREAADAYELNNDDAYCERIATTLHGLLRRTNA